jgi:cytochrome c-type biogenesis protein CcmH/NrfF
MNKILSEIQSGKDLKLFRKVTKAEEESLETAVKKYGKFLNLKPQININYY